MLDNLRSMAVFACVVERGSFSGAARDLGITTSAVSQQVRALEEEMDVLLLHRSTRKLSLTEAGQAFFHSCQEMVAAAERGRIRISELRDDLVGDLRIATTPELGAMHVVPALSCWLAAHPGLTVHFEAENRYIDLIDERIDIAIRMSPALADSSLIARPMARVDQILCASPTYLRQFPAMQAPEDLAQLDLLPIDLIQNVQDIHLTNVSTGEKKFVHMPARIHSNNVFVNKALCLAGHGVSRILYVDVQKELARGDLVEVLPQWKLADYILYAVTLKREQQPTKIYRCLEALTQYFSQLPGGRAIER
ncbi:LysR family transcriptional regulator [Alkanindiges sp. WGS2144]|uniref:LysR family transcriptional regulator n=1 Tax=Alkanindiges sp. WGS2144 TaxID=3366808 RepID=UPI003751E68D